MKQENKKLLIKALCDYLLYGVKVCYKISDNDDPIIETLSGHMLDYFNENHIVEVKPYLRPIDSMTDEEKNKLQNLLWFGYPSDDYDINGHRGVEIVSLLQDTWEYAEFDFEEFNDLQDFLNSIHLDYRGLIQMGLALPAPEEMYETETE